MQSYWTLWRADETHRPGLRTEYSNTESLQSEITGKLCMASTRACSRIPPWRTVHVLKRCPGHHAWGQLVHGDSSIPTQLVRIIIFIVWHHVVALQPLSQESHRAWL